MPPEFDVVRVDPDGAALVAGRAEAESLVIMRLDAAALAEVKAGGDGKFVALFTVPPADVPRLLSLMMRLADGVEVAGLETVAIAPFALPEVVAEAVVPPAAPPAALLVTDEGVKVLQKPAPVVAEVAAPVVEAPVVETPVAEAPVAEAPVAEAPVAEAPVVEAPAAEAPIVEAPVVEAPVVQAPVASVAEAVDVLAAVTVETISYSPEGAVQFGGRGQPRQLVRLYLDNAPIAETPIAGDGQWGITNAYIAPGIYLLRADQVDGSGKVTSRFETPFKRETVEALVVAAVPPVAEAPPVVTAAVEPAPVADPLPETASPAGPKVVAVPEANPVPDVAPVGAAQTAPVAEAAPAADATVAVTPASEPTAAPTAAIKPAATLAPDAAAAPAPAPITITVQPGFTLWAIAQQTFGEGVLYVQVFEANKDKIKDPNLIYPGQVFTVPADQ